MTVLAGALLLTGVSSAAAVDAYWQAEPFDKQVDDGTGTNTTFGVRMWGFADCNADYSVCSAPQVPGPQLDLTAGDSLTIHVRNTLNMPVSVIVPGQFGGGERAALDALRARSMTHETLAHSDGSYSWTSVRAGTYLYQSGTMPSLQVPMGLYGALVVNQAAGLPYANIAASGEALLLLSEVDPIQNQRFDNAVTANGDPTTACVSITEFVANATPGYPCSVDYYPALTLINGARTFDTATNGITPGDTFVLRMLNAGQRTHVLATAGSELGLVAEDGNVYPGVIDSLLAVHPRTQSEASLAAGKTMDALVATAANTDVTLPVYDRSPSFSNEGLPNGGAIAGVVIGAGSSPTGPTSSIMDDVYAVTEDTPLNEAAPGVLANDGGLTGAQLVTPPSNGMVSLVADGSFTYTPNENFSGADAFTYTATDGTNIFPAQVYLNVSFANDGPVANDDGPYVNRIGPTITVDAAHGVLGNDTDPDGDALTAGYVDPLNPPAGLTLNADGSFEFTGGTPGTSVTFDYLASDGTSTSQATVTLNFNPVANIALNVHGPGAGDTVTSYRWIVQEDATFDIDPAAGVDPADMLSVKFHRSYMPVVAQGCTGADCLSLNTDVPEAASVPLAAFTEVALDPARRYYVSVLPNDAGSGTGHSIGGAQIAAGTANATVEVLVNNQPIPSAQISVIAFEDFSPTNGVPDPGEPGLGGFEILLEDAAGRYGQSPGFLSQDVNGDPLTNALDCFAGSPPPAGVILTCPDGTALIQNLPPGKFGVIVVPAAGTGNWTQTSTIEGTNVQDTWVQAGEPPYLVEFGAPGYHAFIGFVNPDHLSIPAGDGSNSITGQVTLGHSGRPPDMTAYDTGTWETPLPHTRAWIGLNSGAGGGDNIATVQADADGNFSFAGIPDGTYQLAIWDEYLDTIITYQTVILPGGSDVGTIPVPAWFGRHEHNVFLDTNEDGIRQEGEEGLPDQNVNLRFRDGTIFQSFPTDTTGFVPFDTVFPFGAWQVAEIDYTRFKATGVSIWVDAGGDVSGGPFPGLMNPQPGSPRVETDPAPVLLEGFQSMPSMTTIFEWGKAPYQPGQNGGISGIVFYGSTRGENDPRLTVGDTWEPGIPGVTVRLYREVQTSTGGTALSLVDEVQTDSWDANAADLTGCPGEPASPNAFVDETLNGDATRCFDGIRNWEQVRPGAVFDGGYAFGDIPPGRYVVEVVPPPGYEVIKEEDKNVDFGDAFAMAPVPLMMASAFLVTLPDAAMVAEAQAKQWGIAQPECVGPDHLVPDTLSLFPGDVDTYAPFAGAMRPLCTRKVVVLSDQSQGAADFHLFTSTPVAGQYQGLTTDDIAIEPNPASPQFGDKWGPAYLPITQRDFKGNVVYHGYTDAFGHYNGLVPSTFSANIPIPSGYSPNMHSVCLNESFLPNGDPDPLHNPAYGTFCYTLMYMPGTTTYLDTPILPSAAFAAGFNPVDCALPTGYPVVSTVDNVAVAAGGTLTLTSQGTTLVPNPDYEGPLALPPHNVPTVSRDYGFGGTAGRVTLGNTPLTGVSWSDGSISGTVPAGLAAGEYELVVTRSNGSRSINTVTVTVGDTPDAVVSAGGSIQAAIDAAAPGDLIVVQPGTYKELVVMWKPVRLQGSGAATIINAVKQPFSSLDAWRNKVLEHLADVSLLPGQPDTFDLVGPGLLSFEMGGGITVMGAASGPNAYANHPSRIDGFSITGADGGGGIYVNGYADNLVIANNNITGNTGVRHGGVRIGQPFLPLKGDGLFGFNDNVSIHHNSITLNGAQGDDAVGGGVAICTGADNYSVANNYICGNFSVSDGAGIGHLGLSDNGVIRYNKVLFNQNFNQGLDKAGAGVFIGGEPPLAAGALSLGAGDVQLDANLIQGNQAGSGHGGGVRTHSYNGRDVELNPGNAAAWHHLRATNNLIVNNVAAGWGGGVSLEDTASADFILNTIANNDTTGTAAATLGAGPEPAGIASEPYSLELAAVVPAGNYPNPVLTHNVIWHNRAFTYDDTVPTAPVLLPALAPAAVGACAPGANYVDLGVIGGGSLAPEYTILSDASGYPANVHNSSTDPLFVKEYCNTGRSLGTVGPMSVAAEPVEGGNFISVFFGPLTREWPAGSGAWNYHLATGSPAIDAAPGGGTNQPAGANVGHDVDGQDRPRGPRVDQGGDEWWPSLRLTAVTPPTTLSGPNGDTVNFGNISGSGTRTSTVTVTNYGLTAVTVSAVAVTDTEGQVDYTKGADSCTGSSLVPGASCTVAVNFIYNGGNTKNGTMTITHDGTGSPQAFPLTGI